MIPTNATEITLTEPHRCPWCGRPIEAGETAVKRATNGRTMIVHPKCHKQMEKD